MKERRMHMKTWNTPKLETLDLNQTEHNWTGIYKDGGYIGDGQVSGHLQWCPPQNENPNPGEAKS